MKNKIITSEGNVQFQFPDGKIVNVHPNHLYTVFNEDTVSFILIALPPSSGLAIMASKAEDLELDGQTYSIADLPNAVAEAFAEAGAQARCEIVDELPTTGKTNTIYLVPQEEGENYDEYIYLKDEQRWELIGDTDIEMKNYLKKVDFNAYSAATEIVINSISGAIDTEISNREAADAVISGAVDSVVSDLASEVSRATAKENEIDTKVDGEISNREAADSVISGAVDTLSTNLSNEVQRAQNAESALDSKINALSGNVDDIQAEVDVLSADLDDEVSARTQADEALSGAVDSVISDLASEVSRAEGAEDALDDKIDAEISNREAADSVISGAVDTLSTDIQNEAQRAISAETELSDKVDAVSGDVEDIKSEIETIGDDAIVDAEYVSSSTTIDFYNTSGDVVASIDASDFIVDGMVDDVRIENGSLVIDFNTASGKQDISIPLTDIFDPSNYYDKDDVDGLIADVEDRIAEDEEVTAAGLNVLNDALSGKADSDDVYTKAEVDGKVALKADLSALNNEISARTDGDNALDSKIDDKVVELTQSEYDSLVDKKPSVLYVITDAVEVNMNDYYKKTETSGATEIQTALDAKVNTSDFNTYSANTQTAINGKANSADVYTKSQVYTKSEVDEAIAEIDLSEIEDRISEDEEVTAAGLNAVNDKFDGLKLKKLSQAAYDALSPNYDSNTLYIITD
jgi:predicted  nucleic acid-binding Zn-ribbon protein